MCSSNAKLLSIVTPDSFLQINTFNDRIIDVLWFYDKKKWRLVALTLQLLYLNHQMFPKL